MIILGNLSPHDSITLDITPGFPPSLRGRFTVSLTVYLADHVEHAMFHIYEDNIPLLAPVTKDVYKIDCKIRRHSSFPAGPPINYNKTFRVDELILLSIAQKFLKGLHLYPKIPTLALARTRSVCEVRA